MPADATVLTSGLTRTRPSTSEYSVCTRRWTKETGMNEPWAGETTSAGLYRKTARGQVAASAPDECSDEQGAVDEGFGDRSSLLQQVAHRREGAPVNDGRPQPLQGFQMGRGRVTLVAGQPVAGGAEIQRAHFAVTTDLGQYRRRRDCRHLSIALDDRGTAHRQPWAAVAVDQGQTRRHAESLHRALHRQHGGVKDVQPIDFLDLGTRDAPGEGLLADFLEQRLATNLAELLRVVETEDGPRRIENHRRGDHRTTERATTDLVDAGDEFFDEIEIVPELHHGLPTSSSTASAAWLDASRRRVRWISSKPSVCTSPCSSNGESS